jgi:hypothetical protein
MQAFLECQFSTGLFDDEVDETSPISLEDAAVLLSLFPAGLPANPDTIAAHDIIALMDRCRAVVKHVKSHANARRALDQARADVLKDLQHCSPSVLLRHPSNACFLSVFNPHSPPQQTWPRILISFGMNDSTLQELRRAKLEKRLGPDQLNNAQELVRRYGLFL